MKAFITRYKVSNLLEETGDDMVFIHLFFKIDEQPELRMPLIFSYEDLLKFIDNVNKDAGNYLHNIRKGIRGYGPKHSIVFRIMNEENFDLEPYIHQYMESKSEQYLLQHIEWCERIQIPENNQKVDESYKELKSLVNDDFRQSNMNYTAYLDALDQAIHETTLKYFPSLFEKGDKHLKAYQSKLIDVTLKFSSDVDRIMHDKFDQYWEERYDKENKK